MALNSVASKHPAVTSDAINRSLDVEPPFKNGLSIEQLRTVIDKTDYVRSSIVKCTHLPYANFLTVLGSIVESGHVALLVFKTGERRIWHVVTVFGYTRNSDEWHPEAIPAYSGPQSSLFYPASFWIDHYLIHDDNFGPYFAFNSRALQVDKKVRPRYIVALHPICPTTRPDFAEGTVATLLAKLLPILAPYGRGRWFEMMTRERLRYVLRTVLIRREDYLKHLRESNGHDGSAFKGKELDLLARLPEWLWMVEITLPQLYTGNRSKLGEVLIDAMAPQPDAKNPSATVVAVRLPSLLLWGLDGKDSVQLRSLSVVAHSTIYQHRNHQNVW